MTRNMKMCVYMMWCEATEKLYVGQSTGPLGSRVRAHVNAARKGQPGRLYDELRLLGLEAFEVFVLEACSSIEELNSWERCWIEYTSATETAIGYNERAGGNNHLHSEETRAKCREAGMKGAGHGHKGKQHGPKGAKFGHLSQEGL